MTFPGGSAWNMANQLMGGFILASPVSLKRLTIEELRALHFELEKLMREQRSVVPDQEDQPELQKRNQKIQKLNQSMNVLNNFISLRLKGRA